MVEGGVEELLEVGFLHALGPLQDGLPKVGPRSEQARASPFSSRGINYLRKREDNYARHRTRLRRRIASGSQSDFNVEKKRPPHRSLGSLHV